MKKTAWALHVELRVAALWVIGGVPLRFGMWLRARLLPPPPCPWQSLRRSLPAR